MNDLRHLQLVILSIAKDIDAFCTKHQIQYSLNGGSAIGAVRHQGFIPWDDDFDLQMTADNYRRFVKLARKEFNSDKYYFEEGLKDWPLDFCKIKLKGTVFGEKEGYAGKNNMRGIFVDIFRVDSAAPTTCGRIIQYACCKLRSAYLLKQRGYKSASLPKKIAMRIASMLKITAIRKFIEHQVFKYDGKNTGYVGLLTDNTHYPNCFFPADIFNETTRVRFEDTTFSILKNYDAYLKRLFGDYMQLPPESKRQNPHLTNVDFGKY